ncbi:MAG TPA: response regulator [Deltaproteobacteria bacterium]|nr:response regulator [Deltaproteobacteria bacterium]
MKPDRENIKVLVVDEDPEMRIFLSTVLSSGGFMPVITENGAEGLRRAAEEKPAIIIMDVMMSGKASFQIYHCLRQDKKLRDIPVIMLSALSRNTVFHFQKYQSPDFGNRVPEPDAYIEKPPEADELLDIVNSLLSGP